MANTMDSLHGIAAALMIIEINRGGQRLFPNFPGNGKWMRQGLSIPEGIRSRTGPRGETEPGIPDSFVFDQLRCPFVNHLSALVQQLERRSIRCRCQSPLAIPGPVPHVRDKDFPFRDIPAFIMVRDHLLEFQRVEVYGNIRFSHFRIITGTGLANFQPQHAVPGEIIDLPEHLHPAALGKVQVGFPAGGERSVRSGAYQIKGKTNVGVPGGMDVHPKGEAVPLAPILGAVPFQRDAGHAPLLSTEAVPRGPVGRILQLRAVYQRNPLAQCLPAAVHILPGIFQGRVSFPDHPSAFFLHIIQQAGSQHRFLCPTLQHGDPRLLSRAGKQHQQRCRAK